MNLDDLTVLNDIKERLAAITPEQIVSACRKMTPVNRKLREKVIGDIDRETTRALYTLVAVMSGEELLELAMAYSETDEIREQDHKKKAAFLDMLGDVARELFFAQAKVDCGYHERTSVGIRRDWKLVQDTSRNGPSAFLTRLMGSVPTGGDEGGSEDASEEAGQNFDLSSLPGLFEGSAPESNEDDDDEDKKGT